MNEFIVLIEYSWVPPNLDYLIEITEDFTTGVLSTALLVIHDTVRGSKNDVTEGTGGEEVGNPLLDIGKGNVETGRDDTALVEATDEVDDDLARALIINDLELTNVTVLEHNLQELDNDLGGRTKENLTATTLLSIGHGLKTHRQNTHQHHCELWGKEKTIPLNPDLNDAY